MRNFLIKEHLIWFRCGKVPLKHIHFLRRRDRKPLFATNQSWVFVVNRTCDDNWREICSIYENSFVSTAFGNYGVSILVLKLEKRLLINWPCSHPRLLLQISIITAFPPSPATEHARGSHFNVTDCFWFMSSYDRFMDKLSSIVEQK